MKRFRVVLLQTAGIAALLAALAPQRAQACGSSEPVNYFTFGSPSPADAANGVSLDAPIVLGVNAYSIGGSPIVPSFLHIETAVLTDADGNLVPLRSPTGDSWGTPQFSQVFAPSLPLAPNTKYHFGAQLAEQTVPRPTEATGVDHVDIDFTTGDSLAPALTLTGELEISTSVEQVPQLVCTNNCGPCTESGTRSARVAHVRLPVVNGGNGQVGYQAVVYLSDEQAIAVGTEKPFAGPVYGHELNLQTWLRLDSDTPLTADIELPIEPQPYHPCFTLQVWDPGERHVAALAKCLDQKVTPITTGSDPVPPSDEPGDASPSTPSSTPSTPSSSSSEACSVVGGVGQRGPRAWLGLGLLALGFAASARRSRRHH